MLYSGQTAVVQLVAAGVQMGKKRLQAISDNVRMKKSFHSIFGYLPALGGVIVFC